MKSKTAITGLIALAAYTATVFAQPCPKTTSDGIVHECGAPIVPEQVGVVIEGEIGVTNGATVETRPLRDVLIEEGWLFGKTSILIPNDRALGGLIDECQPTLWPHCPIMEALAGKP